MTSETLGRAVLAVVVILMAVIFYGWFSKTVTKSVEKSMKKYEVTL